MDLTYLLTPCLAWLVAGGLKFIMNSLKSGQWAFHLIGYGGLPSTHSAMVSSMVALIACKEGIGHPAFGIAMTLALIVMLDAYGLRRQIGKQASAINHLMAVSKEHAVFLRESMGHTGVEIVAGILVGAMVAVVVKAVFS